jgi:hypothetical protein
VIVVEVAEMYCGCPGADGTDTDSK